MAIPADAPPGRSEGPSPALAAAILAGAAFAAYARGFGGMFTYDDMPAIVHNPTIRHLWPLGRVLRPLAGGMTVSGRPLLNLSLALNYAVSGLAPWSYHAFNLLVHILAAWTLFGVIRRTRPGAFFALAVALLWTVHPLQTQAVMYVVQRAEALMALFYLLTLYCFIRGASGGSRAWYALSCLACLAGMATKEVMVSAPVMVFLYDRTFVSGSLASAWARRWRYYLALAATWIPLGIFVASTGGNRGATSGFNVGVRWSAYWLTQFKALCCYLKLSVWPHPLIFEYGPYWVKGAAEVLPYAAVVLALAAATLWAWWRRPAWGYLGVFFFAILAPTSLVPGTRQMIVEHRMYLALAPVLIALGGLASWLARRAGGWTAGRRVRAAALGAVAVGLIALSARRVELYRSDLALWADTAAKRPDNPYALYDLGFILFRLGHPAEAERYYDRVLALNPNYADVRVDLGNALVRLGRVREAMVQFEAALRINPRFPEAHNNYGNALAALGQGGRAIEEYQAALRLDPDYPEADYNLGIALASSGRPDQAMACYRRALELDPDYATARVRLGTLLAQSGHLPDAAAQFREAIRLQPDLAEAHHNLGTVLLSQGQVEPALSEYAQALRCRPDFAEGHNELGGLYARYGRYREARAEFLTALRLQPDLASARRNLAQVDLLLGGAR